MDRHTRKGLTLTLGVGVGLGLIAGSVLTAMAQRPPDLTNAEIMQRARALGMVPLSELPKAPAPAQTQAQPRPQSPVQPEAQSKAVPPAEVPPAQAPAPVVITVLPDMAFQEVMDALSAAGLVKDPDAFLARAYETGAVTRLRVGAHSIRPGATTDEILAKLTSASE